MIDLSVASLSFFSSFVCVVDLWLGCLRSRVSFYSQIFLAGVKKYKKTYFVWRCHLLFFRPSVSHAPTASANSILYFIILLEGKFGFSLGTHFGDTQFLAWPPFEIGRPIGNLAGRLGTFKCRSPLKPSNFGVFPWEISHVHWPISPVFLFIGKIPPDIGRDQHGR